MKDLWRRTLELIRRYPVLCVPVLWAGVLGYGFNYLRWIILHEVLPSFLSPQRSVLSGMVTDVHPKSTGLVYLAGGLTTYFCQYGKICCFVLALMMTAKILGNVRSGQGQDNPYADLSIARRRGGWLLLSFLIWVLGGATELLFFLAASTYANSVHNMRLITRPYVIGMASFGMLALLAYFLTPMALRLLSGPIGGEQIARGRKSSLLVATAIAGLAAIQTLVPKTYGEGLLVQAIFGILLTLVVGLPYVPLFVALSLVAAEREAAPGAGDEARG